MLLSLACSLPQEEKAFAVVDYSELEKLIHQEDDQLYVINFWATWCVPCVEELPEFMEVNHEYGSKIKMILVSLDEASKLETAVKSMKEKLGLDTDIYLLDDIPNMNHWIEAVDANWSGAIPATLLVRNGEHIAFEEDKLSKDDLIQLIEQNL